MSSATVKREIGSKEKLTLKGAQEFWRKRAYQLKEELWECEDPEAQQILCAELERSQYMWLRLCRLSCIDMTPDNYKEYVLSES